MPDQRFSCTDTKVGHCFCYTTQGEKVPCLFGIHVRDFVFRTLPETSSSLSWHSSALSREAFSSRGIMRTHPISWRRSRLAGAYSQGFIFSGKLQEACSLFRFARELGPRSKVSRDGQIVFCHLRPGTSWISEASGCATPLGCQQTAPLSATLPASMANAEVSVTDFNAASPLCHGRHARLCQIEGCILPG
jgi:hypothetical protein